MGAKNAIKLQLISDLHSPQNVDIPVHVLYLDHNIDLQSSSTSSNFTVKNRTWVSSLVQALVCKPVYPHHRRSEESILALSPKLYGE